MAGSKPTRRSSRRSTSSNEEQEPAPRRRRRRTARTERATAQEVEEEQLGIDHPRLGDKRVKNWNAPKPPDLARRAKAEAPPPSTRTIILAMSPGAANILRALIGRANHDVPELYAIYNELEDQLAHPNGDSGRQRSGKKRRRAS